MFVLIHSPLVGAFTWSRVAEEMQRRGIDVLVPHLRDSENANAPYWKQHADSFAQALAATPPQTRMILVAHSGAGPRLPIFRDASPRPIAGYIFVDAGVPISGATYLDLFASENVERAREFEKELRAGARFPTWSAEDLAEIIPDAITRETLANDLRPRDLAFFQEPLPTFENFPDAPCAYLQFSEVYDRPAREAQARGWAFRQIRAGHFHMLVDPVAVTDALLDLTRNWNK